MLESTLYNVELCLPIDSSNGDLLRSNSFSCLAGDTMSVKDLDIVSPPTILVIPCFLVNSTANGAGSVLPEILKMLSLGFLS